MHNKYGAKKVMVDGIKFDSKAEAAYYQIHKTGVESGVIKMQVPFILQEKFRLNGKAFREIKYIADFVFYDKEGNILKVVDVKGETTPVFNLKAKMFAKMFGREIVLAKFNYSKKTFKEL